MVERITEPQPEYKLPFDWMFNWLETSNPWVIRLSFVLALLTYVTGLITGEPMWWISSLGLWWWGWIRWNAAIKSRGAARHAEFKARMEAIEGIIRAREAARKRIRALEAMMVPDWML